MKKIGLLLLLLLCSQVLSTQTKSVRKNIDKYVKKTTDSITSNSRFNQSMRLAVVTAVANKDYASLANYAADRLQSLLYTTFNVYDRANMSITEREIRLSESNAFAQEQAQQYGRRINANTIIIVFLDAQNVLSVKAIEVESGLIRFSSVDNLALKKPKKDKMKGSYYPWWEILFYPFIAIGNALGNDTGFSVGIKGGVGLNFAYDITGITHRYEKEQVKHNYNARGNIMLFTAYRFNDYIGIEFDLGVGLQNAVGFTVLDNSNEQQTAFYGWHSIDMDLLFKVHSEGGYWVILFFGPSMRFMAGKVFENNNTLYPFSWSAKSNFGLTFGTGWEIPIGNFSMFIIALKSTWLFTVGYSYNSTEEKYSSVRLHEPITLQLGYGLRF